MAKQTKLLPHLLCIAAKKTGFYDCAYRYEPVRAYIPIRLRNPQRAHKLAREGGRKGRRKVKIVGYVMMALGSIGILRNLKGAGSKGDPNPQGASRRVGGYAVVVILGCMLVGLSP
jgi:hypothetical protein